MPCSTLCQQLFFKYPKKYYLCWFNQKFQELLFAQHSSEPATASTSSLARRNIEVECSSCLYFCNRYIDNNLIKVVNFSPFWLLQVATATAPVKPAACTKTASKSSSSEVKNLYRGSTILSRSAATIYSLMRLKFHVSTPSFISGSSCCRSSEANSQA